MILLENVSKQYDGGRYAVRDISLRVPPGQMLVLLGGSGCGKTTTLKMIMMRPRPHYTVQSTTGRFGTRLKSRVLRVTTVAPCSSATAAMRRSILPTFSLMVARAR